MGGVAVCVIGGHVQLQLQLGASSGIGGSAGATFVASDAESASQLGGLGAGFGGSISPGLNHGLDRSYSFSNGKVYNSVSFQRGAGIEVTPELFTIRPHQALGYLTPAEYLASLEARV
jgi:hypothetical protein